MSDQDVEHPTRELSHDTGHTSELETESALVGTLRLMEVPRSEQDDSNPPTSHEQSYPPQVVPVSEQRPLGSGEVFEREQIEAALTYQAEPSQLQSAPHERPELPSTTSRAQPTALDNSIPASKPSPAEDEHMCLTSVPSEPAALSITALASTPSAAKDESVQSTSTDLDVHLSSELSELTPLSVAASASVTTAAPDEQMPSTSTENLDMHLPSEQTQPTPLSVEALASIPTAAHDELMSSPSTDLDMHFPSEQAEPTPLSVETPASVTIAAHDEQMPSPSTDLDMHLFSEPTEPATLSVAALAPITTAAQDEQMTSPSTDLDLDLSSGQTDPATLSVEAQASVATAAHDEQMPSTDLDMHLPSEQTDPATLSVEAPASVASAAHDEQMLSPSTDLDMHLLSERTEPATLSLAALASIPTVAQDEQTSLPSTDSESTPGSVAGSVLVPGQNEQLHESNPTTQPASESVAAPTQGSRQRPEQSLRNEGVNTTRQRSTIRFTFRQQGESTGRTNSASSNVSHPQVQEFHRFREEQRRLQLLAAERRAAMNGWHNSSDGDLQASVTPPAEAAETRTRNAATSATNSASAGVEGAVAEGAVGQEIVDTAATAATGRAGSGNVRRITIRGNPAGQSIAIIQNNSGDQSVLMPQLPGVAHRTLRVAPGARHFTVPVGAGANIQIRGAASQQAQNNYSNNPNAIPRVPIPRLEAQVIPISTHDLAASANENEDEQHDHYRCTICYEFFVDPSSCGQCSSRFCHACLLRVASSRSSNNPSSSKCPGCRAILTVEDIVRDETLGEELKAANLQVLCSYRGCDQRLPSASMKEHEQSCGYMPMRCKNATMGCSWNGLRKDLAHHLSNHCALEQVAGFVEQYRQSRADHQAAIIALQRSQTMNTQLTEVNSGLMRRSLPSPTNIFDVLNLIYTSSCTTSYFLFTADIWRLFLVQQGAQESRALVCNFLYMLPTILNVARVSKREASALNSILPSGTHFLMLLYLRLPLVVTGCCLRSMLSKTFRRGWGTWNLVFCPSLHFFYC